MSRLSYVFVLLLSLATSVHGEQVQVDILYSNGQIVSGPLSSDLAELPEFVMASFTLNGSGAGSYSLADVLASSLAFGDGSWSEVDLASFDASISPDPNAVGPGAFLVDSLSYTYDAIDTPSVHERIALNFPLQITGTDVASGQEFHYLYDSSLESVAVVPEPSSIALAALGLAVFAASFAVKKEVASNRSGL